MKVSVIISTRNRPGLLINRSLPSVLNQTFKDFEVIIIDDASDTFPVMQGGYPNNVRIFHNKTRKGLAWNKNFGIKKAKGDFIVFLDDDNEFHPDFLGKTLTKLAMRSVDVIGVGKYVIYPEGKMYHLPKLPCSINDGFLMKKTIFKEISFDSDLRANEDADFGLQFAKSRFRISLLDEPLMTVYASPIFNTTSYSDYTDYHLDGLCKFWLKHHDYKEYIGRMFMLSSGKKWFRYMYWLEQKLKRYYQIWLSLRHH